MKIFITGGSGLLGSHIIHQGLAEGHSFRVLTRRIPRRSLLAELKNDLEILELDPADESLVTRELFAGSDCFINCLGFASPFLKDRETVRLVNDAIPRQLFRAARQADLKQLVHISSIATMSDGSACRVVSEKDQGCRRRTCYAESKYRFDEWCAGQKFKLLRIHPCYMLGKWDSVPSSGAILFAMQMNRVSHWIDNIKNFVSPADVARGIYLALDRNITGSFILGNENRSIADFVRLAAAALNMRPDNFCFAEKNTWELPEAELKLMEEFCLSNPVDIGHARRILGYKPVVTLEAMLDETIAYFTGKKMLRK